MDVLQNIPKNSNTVFNFISSWFVYGKNNEIPFREDYSQCNPTGFYSITKYCAEQLFKLYSHSGILDSNENFIATSSGAYLQPFCVK